MFRSNSIAPQASQAIKYFVTPEISKNGRITSKFFYPVIQDPALNMSNERLTRMLMSGGGMSNDVQITNNKSIFSGTKPKNSKNFSKRFVNKI